MQYKDYYKILGVAKNASDKEIKEAFRRQARKYHPDVNKEKDAEKRFKEIAEAYEVLKDPEKRKKYDLLGLSWTSGDFPPPGAGGFTWRVHVGGAGASHPEFGDAADFSDFFRTFFAGGFGRGGRRPAQDVEQPLDVTLEDAYYGSDRLVARTYTTVCDLCGGKGLLAGSICVGCRGTGVTARTEKLKVKIPRGVREGSRIRIRGKGEGGGDLYLVVRMLPHPLFDRKGDDLYIEVEAPLLVALRGGEVGVPTLGAPVQLKIPPGTIAGRTFRLRGLGMPRMKGGFGDLYSKVVWQLPSRLSPEDARRIERILQNYEADESKNFAAAGGQNAEVRY